MSGLVKVPFHGDVIEATPDGEVGLRRLCENIGVDYSTQLAKLRAKGWAVVGLCPTTGSDGKTYDMVTISLDSIPMWLATIDAERVAEAVRPKIELYQKECARVLRDHFFGAHAERPAGESAAMLREKRLLAKLAIDTAEKAASATGVRGPALGAWLMRLVGRLTGESVTALLPAATEGRKFSPADMAREFGVSPQRVGLTISALDLRGDKPGLCERIYDQAAHVEGKTVEAFRYTDKAKEQIRARLVADGHLPGPGEAN